MIRFDNSLILITGGSRGIGAVAAERFLSLGAQVVSISRTKPTKFHASIASVQADLSDSSRLEALMESVLSQFGVPTVLVNNAGINLHSALERVNYAVLEEELRVNLVAPIVLTSMVGEHMAQNGGGSIINVSSVKASEAGSSVGYAASKAGIESLTRSAALAFGSRNVRVNAVAPGPVETEMFQSLAGDIRHQYLSRLSLGRFPSSEDVVNAIVFLASNLAMAITGSVLRVDGGYRL